MIMIKRKVKVEEKSVPQQGRKSKRRRRRGREGADNDSGGMVRNVGQEGAKHGRGRKKGGKREEKGGEGRGRKGKEEVGAAERKGMEGGEGKEGGWVD